MSKKQQATLLIKEGLEKDINSQVQIEEIEEGSITPTTFKSRSFTSTTDWYIDSFEYQGNQVLRYGINSRNVPLIGIENEGINLYNLSASEEQSVASSKYKPEDAQRVRHHSLEKCLLKEAIGYLLDNHNCKTVLVDIFARLNGEIKVLGGLPETHTVVLYKNPSKNNKHEVTVIDPSNFLFSSHLSNVDIMPQHALLEGITTIHKGLQIYKPSPTN